MKYALAILGILATVAIADIVYIDNVTSIGTDGGISYYDLSGTPAPSGWTDTNVYAALWEFETTNSTQTLDTSGNGYNASNLPSVASGPTWTILGTNQYGRVEHGYTFDASDDKFKAENATQCSLTNGASDGSFTLAIWVKPDTVNAYRGFMSKYDSSAGGKREWYFNQNNTGGAQLWQYQNSVAYRLKSTPNNVLTNGIWKHVLVTGDATNYTFYIDGVAVTGTMTTNGSYTGMIADDANEVYIGSLEGTTQLADGIYDNAMILRYELGTNSIMELYQNTHPTNNVRIR